jgi:hypothetical protein
MEREWEDRRELGGGMGGGDAVKGGVRTGKWELRDRRDRHGSLSRKFARALPSFSLLRQIRAPLPFRRV